MHLEYLMIIIIIGITFQQSYTAHTESDHMSILSARSIADVYHQHQPWLLNVFRYKLGNYDDAADLAQDAFIRLLKKPITFESSAATKAYLSKMANGMCIDFWRHEQIKQTWLETLAAHPSAVIPSPEQQTLLLELMVEVDAMLRQLSINARSAFLLSQIDGLTYSQVASVLNVSERMIKKYMAEAMLKCLVFKAQLNNAVISA